MEMICLLIILNTLKVVYKSDETCAKGTLPAALERKKEIWYSDLESPRETPSYVRQMSGQGPCG
jgi:hypothetical protein